MDLRPRPALALRTIGAICIVLGGLVAAITGPLDLDHGSWLAAYLVLVGGVAQHVMGWARSWGMGRVQGAAWGWTQVGGWNMGNVLVVAGTLAGRPWAVHLGSVALVLALVVALHATKTGGPSSWLEHGYRALLVVLLISIPVGMVLSQLRN